MEVWKWNIKIDCLIRKIEHLWIKSLIIYQVGLLFLKCRKIRLKHYFQMTELISYLDIVKKLLKRFSIVMFLKLFINLI